MNIEWQLAAVRLGEFFKFAASLAPLGTMWIAWKGLQLANKRWNVDKVEADHKQTARQQKEFGELMTQIEKEVGQPLHYATVGPAGNFVLDNFDETMDLERFFLAYYWVMRKSWKFPERSALESLSILKDWLTNKGVHFEATFMENLHRSIRP